MNELEKYEDTIRLSKQSVPRIDKISKYCDFIYYTSSVTEGITLAMRVLKPERPGYIKVGTHGWHMSIPAFEEYDCAQSEFLQIDVDMRGRAFSDGQADCNGFELFDVIDAVEFAKKKYADYIISPETVLFEAGSGGGGNAYALAVKFPDYFSHIALYSGMSDYEVWYKNDKSGEFRDELDVWIGSVENSEAYASRSGIAGLKNLCSPISIVHGETDIRVPAYHARNFVKKADELGKSSLVEYLELKGVGAGGHFSYITPEQNQEMLNFILNGHMNNLSPVKIPRKGSMAICGYLVTKEFSIILNDINRVAEINYDLDKNEFKVSGVSQDEYKLTIANI